MVFFELYMEKTNLLIYNQLMIEYKENKHSLMYKANSDLSLYSAGYEDCTPGYSYGPTLRAYQLIHFVLSGEGEFRINEHVYHLKAGDAFLIPAGKVTYYEASKKDPWSYTWISFIGISSESYLYQIMTSTDDIYVIHGLQTEKYYRAIQQIMKLDSSRTSHFLESNSILFHIISMLFEDVNFSESTVNRISIIDEIKFYFDINYAENIKLKEVASHFGLHQNYLTRAFHSRFGISPKKYLMNLKLTKAARLLMTTQLPVSIISSSLGFEDQLAFSRTFKKTYDLSPSEYRNHQNPDP